MITRLPSVAAAAAGLGHASADRALDEGSALRARVALRILHGRHPLRYYVFVPESFKAGGQVVALVHGVSRNAREQILAFAVHARRSGVAIVAPVFSRETCRDYQQLGWTRRGWRTDELLEAVVDEVAADTGGNRGAFALFGYSGGAEMAHRYAFANPGRVSRLVACAAGYYTMPEAHLPFPYGLDCSELATEMSQEGGGRAAQFAPAEFLKVPILAVVGTRDTKRDRKFRASPELDAMQGRDRVSRAQRWVAALQTAAAARGIAGQYAFAAIPKARHDFADCIRRGLADLVWPWLTGPTPAAPPPDSRAPAARPAP